MSDASVEHAGRTDRTMKKRSSARTSAKVNNVLTERRPEMWPFKKKEKIKIETATSSEYISSIPAMVARISNTVGIYGNIGSFPTKEFISIDI